MTGMCVGVRVFVLDSGRHAYLAYGYRPVTTGHFPRYSARGHEEGDTSTTSWAERMALHREPVRHSQPEGRLQ